MKTPTPGDWPDHPLINRQCATDITVVATELTLITLACRALLRIDWTAFLPGRDYLRREVR